MTNEIEEIAWDTFDERTRIWLQVLSNIPVEAVVRMLRLDLNTGFATLPGSERGAWPACYPFTWNGVFVASFEDGDDKGANLTEFVEYARREADRALYHEAMLTVVGLLMREDVAFTTTSLPLYGLGVFTLVDRTVRLDTDDGRTTVSVADLDGEYKGSVKITMGPNGVSYPYLTMEELIREATGRVR